MATEQEIYRINPIQQVLQIPARVIVDIIFPHQKLDPDSQKNLNKAAEMMEDGYGILTPTDHFAKLEFGWIFSVLFSNPTFSQRGGLMILGAHECYAYIRRFAKAVGVDTMPVVVYEGLKVRGGLKSETILSGMYEFLEASSKRLAYAGIVLATPQGHRQPRLGEAQSTLINDILSTAEDYEDAQKLAVLPIGVGLTGRKRLIRSIPESLYRAIVGSDAPLKSPYEDKGFHFFEEGIVTVRPPRTRAEVNEITGGKPKDIEKWTFKELKAAVPENYR